MDKLIALDERLSIGVMDRRTEQVDNSTIASPLRMHEELCSFEVALDELKFCDQLVARLYEFICDDPPKSAKACLSRRNWRTRTLYTERKVNLVLVRTNFTGRFKVSPHYCINIFVGVLCSRFRSATCPEKEVIHVMDLANQAFLHDAREKVSKREWRSKEMVS
ncbi:unnamed protein product [Schistosoma curassoni]|uniref:DUF4806 domain-containing protein n=1 Tax=Schistosoma curassoni TaxID=6186 RepID=A0A183KZT3_9TREM|nr:unnamed protein product [Schistosoma curassoni]